MTKPNLYRIRLVGVPTQPPADGEPLFWSNSDGWVGSESASHFTREEVVTLHLPIGGAWEPAREPYIFEAVDRLNGIIDQAKFLRNCLVHSVPVPAREYDALKDMVASLKRPEEDNA